jgi:hypothetical protein
MQATPRLTSSVRAPPRLRSESSSSANSRPIALPCHAFRANALRLLLHALAYDLLHLFRLRVPPDTTLGTARLATLRLRLLQLGARIVLIQAQLEHASLATTSR